MGLLVLPGRRIQHAQAAVAVGLEWAHAEFFGQGQGLAVVGGGGLGLRRITTCNGFTEEAVCMRLVATPVWVP